MSINRIGFLSFPPSIPASTQPMPVEGRPFSDVMRSVSAGNPSPEEIKTWAAYLRLRINASLMRAMGGGDHDSSSQLFGSRTFGIDSLLSMAPRPAAESSTASTASTSDIVAKAAATFNVDPSLVSAVIKAESGGNPRATSPAGAMGLMQLMPGTARDLGVSDPYDPTQNVMGGTKYLKSLLNRYGGNRDLALAAYNWGPGNLEKSHRSMPRETVDYVARIKKFLGVKA